MIDNNELIAKLEENDFDAMWELVTDIMLKISGKLYLSDKFDKLFSPYILCRYISMRPSLIDYAIYLNSVNTNSRLTKIQFYKLAYNLIPKQSNAFIKYIKKKEKSPKENKGDEQVVNQDIKTSLFDL